jgi:transposase, IS5 family
MAERTVGQLSLVDALVADRAGANRVLERIADLVRWDAVKALLVGLRDGALGQPGYSALVMFKALLLQQMYGLSDPQLEEALADRLSFRRFLGLSLSERTPDHTTIWRFREDLIRSGLAERAFTLITEQIAQAGLLLKHGTLIDASLVPAAVNAPPVPDPPPPPDADGRPASKLVVSPHDPDAAWAQQNGTRSFGYKMHIAMDQGSRIIRKAILTPANVNETVIADDLICGDEGTVYADKAYTSKARRERLKQRGIRDGIMNRAARCRPLGRWALRRNRIISHRRAPIEPLMALCKNVHRFARARYRGLIRNAGALHLIATAMNLKRWVTRELRQA